MRQTPTDPNYPDRRATALLDALAGESARRDLRGRADLLAGLLTSSTARAAGERVAS